MTKSRRHGWALGGLLAGALREKAEGAAWLPWFWARWDETWEMRGAKIPLSHIAKGFFSLYLLTSHGKQR